MKQAVKATVLILLMSLLSSCSSSQTPADNPQVKSKCETVYETTDNLKSQIDDVVNPDKVNTVSPVNVRVITLSWAYSIIDNSECYEPDLIAQARAIAVTFSK